MWGKLLLLAGAALLGTAVTAGIVYYIVHERITKRNVAELLKKKAGDTIRRNLESGNYNTINVLDVDEDEDRARVVLEVDGEKCGLESTQGTSLEEGDVIEVY